jgi:hypothetical protein
MKCAYHPDVDTELRCSKCGKPICPKCMVQTPVGAKCPDCAKLHKLPTYRVSTSYYLKAGGVALGMALACGAAWGTIEWATPFFSLNLLLAPGAGFAIGEVVSLSSYIFSLWLASLLSGISFCQTLPLAPFSSIYHLVALAFGVFIAVSRLR